MPKSTSSGKCRLCGQMLAKAQMSRHLKSCVACHARATTEARPVAGSFHIVVEATYNPAYWLHLEVPATTTFGHLDGVLRDIWLECCGHMSAFRFPRKRLPSPAGGDIASMFAALAQHSFKDEMEDEQQLMRVQVGKRFAPGVKLEYEYDFGSTTELSLRVLGEHPASGRKPRIRLLARNEPPDIRCTQCGKPATEICAECECAGDGALCKACAAKHECGEEMLLSIVNSPRVGVCAYCGPSVEP